MRATRRFVPGSEQDAVTIRTMRLDRMTDIQTGSNGVNVTEYAEVSSSGADIGTGGALGRLAHLHLELHQTLHHVRVHLRLVALGLLLVERCDQVLKCRVLRRLAVFGAAAAAGLLTSGALAVDAASLALLRTPVPVVLRRRVRDRRVRRCARVHRVHGVPRRVARRRQVLNSARVHGGGGAAAGCGSRVGGRNSQDWLVMCSGMAVGGRWHDAETIGAVAVLGGDLTIPTTALVMVLRLVATVADRLLNEVVGELRCVHVLLPFGHVLFVARVRNSVQRHRLPSLSFSLSLSPPLRTGLPHR